MNLWNKMTLISLLWIFFWSIADAEQEPFAVFDATAYTNKPDLRPYGIERIRLIYAGAFWEKGENRDNLPPEKRVRELARDVSRFHQLIVLDIEHWPWKGESIAVQESARKYLTVLEWFRSEVPGVQLGYYGMPPVRDYWRAVKAPSSKQYAAWQRENDRLTDLAEAVDVLFPSLYAFYPDIQGWKQYAIANIREARRYDGGKAIYVFLMPTYHPSNRLLGGRYIPAGDWQQQLETVGQYADGVVIWHGQKETWDESAAWWRVTKRFMGELKEN